MSRFAYSSCFAHVKQKNKLAHLLIGELTPEKNNRQWNIMQPLLLISYGAPERCDEVVPFLHNLFAGKNVSAERIAAAAQKYEQFAAKT
jgi:hypothetical protein